MSLEGAAGIDHTRQARATKTLMDSYLRELTARGDFGRFFAEDATFEFMGTDQSAEGRSAVEQTIRYFHEQAFDATVETKTLFATEANAALEADFVGTHVGDFAGAPATNRPVRVPYSVIYDVAHDHITALRVYMPMDALMAQIT